MRERLTLNKGKPQRTWLKLDFLDRAGVEVSLELLADTGCPQAIVLNEEMFDRLARSHTRKIQTNFGPMHGGWIRLHTLDLGLVEMVEAFGSDEMAQFAVNSHPDFVGVVGLPVLRLMEYGGDYDTFWIRTPS